MNNLIKVETNEVSIPSLKNKLDEIDKTVYQLAYDGFYGIRLAILMGMWEKGKAIGEYRGVNSQKNWFQLEKETGRDHKSLKKWNGLYEKYPNRKDYQKIAEETADQKF